MGLITLIVLLGFAALYLSKTLKNKPPFIQQVADRVVENMDAFALWGCGYAVAALVITVMANYSGGDMLVRFFANLMIIVMALPFAFERLLPKFEKDVEDGQIKGAQKIISKIHAQEKYVAYIGTAIGLLLFAVLFR